MAQIIGEEREMTDVRNLAAGAHLVTLRCGYCHHGIYVGDGRIVHYAGYCEGHHQGPVEEVPLASFAAGQPVWIEANPLPGYTGPEVVRRARSRLDEHSYRLLTNNCEHFCAWCLSGEDRSEQVHAWRSHPLAALRRALQLARAYHGNVPARETCNAMAFTAQRSGQALP